MKNTVTKKGLASGVVRFKLEDLCHYSIFGLRESFALQNLLERQDKKIEVMLKTTKRNIKTDFKYVWTD